MKRIVHLIVLLSICAVLCSCAYAESTNEILREFGFSGVEIEAFNRLLTEIEPDISEDALQALLTDYIGSSTATSKGSFSEGIYTHPSGFSFVVPDGWTINEDPLGLSVLLIDDASEGEFSSSISIYVTDVLRDEFEAEAQEDWDAYLSQTLTDYTLIAYNSFAYLDAPAHELVCVHRYGEMPLLQYQLLFTKNSQSYVITMTTSEDETIHDSALSAYDELLVHFSIAPDEENG